MLAAVRAAGYAAPTPIPARTIAPALAGHDVIGSAQTGTGKTAGNPRRRVRQGLSGARRS